MSNIDFGEPAELTPEEVRRVRRMMGSRGVAPHSHLEPAQQRNHNHFIAAVLVWNTLLTLADIFYLVSKL